MFIPTDITFTCQDLVVTLAAVNSILLLYFLIHQCIDRLNMPCSR